MPDPVHVGTGACTSMLLALCRKVTTVSCNFNTAVLILKLSEFSFTIVCFLWRGFIHKTYIDQY